MEKIVLQIQQLLEKGESIKKICSLLNLSKNKLYRIRKKYNLKLVNNRKYFYNFNYFEKIDSKEKAYWLGFIFADGYIKKNNSVLKIELSIKDIELLKSFNKCIEGNVPITFRKQKNGVESCILVISSSKFVHNLINLGCVNKKSLITRLPELNSDDLNLSFLLGYYDGDGTANSSYLTCGSYKFLKDIKTKYNLDFEIKTGKNCYVFNIGAELKRKLIKNYEFSLQRKRGIYKGDKGYKTNNLKYRNLPKIHTRKVENRPSVEQLLKEIKETNYSAVGRKYGVSDNTIRKWIKYKPLCNSIE